MLCYNIHTQIVIQRYRDTGTARDVKCYTEISNFLYSVTKSYTVLYV